MIVSRDIVVATLLHRRRNTEARSAEQDLPREVDTERDREQLALLGIDVDARADDGPLALFGD